MTGTGTAQAALEVLVVVGTADEAGLRALFADSGASSLASRNDSTASSRRPLVCITIAWVVSMTGSSG